MSKVLRKRPFWSGISNRSCKKFFLVISTVSVLPFLLSGYNSNVFKVSNSRSLKQPTNHLENYRNVLGARSIWTTAAGAMLGSAGSYIVEKLAQGATNLAEAVGLVERKNFSAARKKLDELWEKIETVQERLNYYSSRVDSISDPTIQLPFLDKEMEWQLRLLDLRTKATELEIKLAALMG